VEDGKESLLTNHFQISPLGNDRLRLQLTPPLDLDQFHEVSAQLRIQLYSPSTGNRRDLLRPVQIVPPSGLLASWALPLAVDAPQGRYWPTLPIQPAGNLQLQGLTLQAGDGSSPISYLPATSPEGQPYVVAQQAYPYRTGEAQSFALLWQLQPGGKSVTQPLTVIPSAVDTFLQPLVGTLTVDPESAANTLSLTIPGAINLSVSDVLLLDSRTGKATSVRGQFDQSRTAEGETRLTLKPGSRLIESGSNVRQLTLQLQKRLDGVATETTASAREYLQPLSLAVEYKAGGKALAASTTTAAQAGSLRSPLANGVGATSTTSAGSGVGSSAAVAAPLVNGQFAAVDPIPQEPAKKRRKRSGNGFAARSAVGPTTLYEYDANGNRTKVTSPLGAVTTYAYDALGRMTRAVDAGGNASIYGYNGQDRLIAATLPRGLTTTYTYDGLARLINETSPDAGNTSRTYDALGNILTQTDAKGQTTTYTYDALSRRSSTVHQDGTRIQYTYDQGNNAQGRLSRIDEFGSDGSPKRSLIYSYDSWGRIVTETRNVAGRDYTTRYQYANGRLVGLTYPSGRRLDYTLNAAGQVVRITLTDQGKTQTLADNVTYRPFAGPVSYTNGAGQTVTRSYDSFGQITGYSLGAQQWQLTYDAGSRITAQADTSRASDTPTPSASYGYDVLDRLISANSPLINQSYSYDPAGNRTALTTASGSQSYTYASNSNRLQTVSGGNAATYTYDANGSRTGDGSRQFDYDARGRLTQAILAGGTLRYEINALGQRVRKQGPASNADRIFQYDLGGRLIAESAADGSNPIDYIWLGELPLALVQ
jgi:YD repeat-containing protein